MNKKIVEANVKLQDENKLLKEDKEILKRRIEKAIEYVEDHTENVEMNIYGMPPIIRAFRGNTQTLLEILKGEYIEEGKW